MPTLPNASTTSHRFAEQGSNPDTPAAGYVRLFFTTLGAFIKNSAGNVIPVQTFKRELVVMANEMWPSTNEGSAALATSESATNKQNTRSLDFDGVGATDEKAEFTVIMPDDWNAGTITYKIWWTAAGGSAAQTVEWNVQARAYANDDAIDQAWGTEIAVSDALIATGDIHRTSESDALTVGGTPSAGEIVQFRIYRDVSDDTLAADAKLLGIKLYFT
jgi:hypothetical protein